MKSSRGFTLVEVMVAITVFSLIMLATLTAIRTMGQVNTRVVATTDRVDEMRSVAQVIRQLIEQTYAGGGNLGSGGSWAGLQQLQSSYFEGDRNGMSWLSPLNGVAGISGLHYLRLQRRRDELVLDIAPYVAGEDGPSWEQKLASNVLIEGIDTFEATYRTRAQGSWAPRHDNEDSQVPQAVRLRIAANGRYWPDLVVAPAAHRPTLQ